MGSATGRTSSTRTPGCWSARWRKPATTSSGRRRANRCSGCEAGARWRRRTRTLARSDPGRQEAPRLHPCAGRHASPLRRQASWHHRPWRSGWATPFATGVGDLRPAAGRGRCARPAREPRPEADPPVGIGAVRRLADRLRVRGRRRIPCSALARAGPIRRRAIRAPHLPLRDVISERRLRGFDPIRSSITLRTVSPMRRGTPRTWACRLRCSSPLCRASHSSSLGSSFPRARSNWGCSWPRSPSSPRAAAASSPRSGRPGLASMSSARWPSRRQSWGRFSWLHSSQRSVLPGSSSRRR